MRVLDGTRHPFFRLIVCMVLWLGVAGVASSGINVNPTSARWSGSTATGIRSTVTLEASFTGTANGVRNYTAMVPVSSSTLGSLAKGALRRGLGWYGVALTLKDLINGAGWVINELKDQVETPAVPGTDNPPGTTVGCWQNVGCSASDAGVISMILGANSFGYDSCSRNSSPPTPTFWWYKCRSPTFEAGAYDNVAVSTQVLTEWKPDFGTGSEAVPVSDTQLGDLLKQSPQVINAILIDPETGAPIRTQEMTDAMNALRKQLEAANGVDPGPDAAPTPDPSATQPMESEWPTFCGWATKVCDFIDWVRSDGEAEKELPEREIQIDPNGWSSGISGGSCPAAETFALNVVGSQAQGEFSWQPLCDFSTMMRPFLIAVASVVAVLILAGLRSSTPK